MNRKAKKEKPALPIEMVSATRRDAGEVSNTAVPVEVGPIKARYEAGAAGENILQAVHDIGALLAIVQQQAADLEATEMELERFKEASGLLAGGDPGGVTPALLSAFIQRQDAMVRAWHRSARKWRAKSKTADQELTRIKGTALPEKIEEIAKIHKLHLAISGVPLEEDIFSGQHRATLLGAVQTLIAERDEAIAEAERYEDSSQEAWQSVEELGDEAEQLRVANRELAENAKLAKEALARRTQELAAAEDVLRAYSVADKVLRKVKEAEAAAGEPLYFIQESRTWHGDMLVFWGDKGGGYVVDIMQAGLYPASHSLGSRAADLYWRPEDLLQALTICANSERLHGQRACAKPLKLPGGAK